jgi:hypothetical protein
MHSSQLRLIWFLSRKIGYDSEILHHLVEKMTNKTSLKELRDDETKKVINKLKQFAGEDIKGYHSHPIKVNEAGEAIEYASPAQTYCIKFYAEKLKFTPKSLSIVIAKRFKFNRYEIDLKQLTKFQATSLIIGLKTQYQRKQAKAELQESQSTLFLSVFICVQLPLVAGLSEISLCSPVFTCGFLSEFYLWLNFLSMLICVFNLCSSVIWI